MKFIRITIYIFLLMAFSASRGLAIERLNKAVDNYGRENYRSALSKIEDYLLDYPKDNLAQDFKKVVLKKMAALHLKKGYTLKSEGELEEASENLRKASEYSPEYTKKIDNIYRGLLENETAKKAADETILHMLKNPEPTESREYDIERRVRERYANTLAETESMDFKELKEEVDKLVGDEEFTKAVELIMGYMNNNPGSSNAQALLNEINRKAAKYYYNEALELIKDEEIEKAKKQVVKSKAYDNNWYKEQVKTKFESAKKSISVGDESEAKSQLKMLTYLTPEDRGPSLYLSLFEEDKTGFLQRSIDLYRNKQYEEAMIRFEYLSLNEPDNDQAELYYYMAAARRYIREQNLNKVKENLIEVLKISPDEKEALDIYDRLQDVMEIMGEG